MAALLVRVGEHLVGRVHDTVDDAGAVGLDDALVAVAHAVGAALWWTGAGVGDVRAHGDAGGDGGRGGWHTLGDVPVAS